MGSPWHRKYRRRHTHLRFQKFFFPFPSPWLSVRTWSLPPAPLSQPLREQMAGLAFHQPAEVIWSALLTDHSSDPLRLSFLFHDLLCLLRDQQLCLFTLPADIKIPFIKGCFSLSHTHTHITLCRRTARMLTAVHKRKMGFWVRR